MAPWHFAFLGYKARLLHPAYLLLVAAVVLVGVALGVAWIRRVRRVRAVVPARLRDRVVPDFSTRREGARLGLVLAGVVLAAGALVQPQCGTGTELSQKMGVDLVVALDVSRSMQARDVRPSRLKRAKLELGELLDRLKGDRFGLVVFAGSAFVQCPLTTDYAAARLFLRAVDPEAMPRQGTDLTDALRTAGRMLEQREGARSKVVVLLTDGEDHSPDALGAAQELADAGVRVFAIGIGSPSGEPIPVLDEAGEVTGYQKDKHGNTVLSRLDEGVLREVARTTGGQYVRANGGDLGVREVVEAMERMEKEAFEARLTTRYEDRSVLLLAPAFVLLVAGTVVRRLRPRRRRSGRRGAAAGSGGEGAGGGPGGPSASERSDRSGRSGRSGRAGGGGRAAALLLLLGLPGLMGAGPFESREPRVARGNEAFAEGDFETALSQYDEALGAVETPEDRARVQYNRGTALAAKGDVEAAREAFESALAGADDTLAAKDLYNLGTSLLASGDPSAAVEALKRALRKRPDDAAARYNLELALKQAQEQQQPQQSQDPQQDSEDEQQQDSEDQQQQDSQDKQQQDSEDQQQQDSQDKQQQDSQDQQQDSQDQQQDSQDQQQDSQDQQQQQGAQDQDQQPQQPQDRQQAGEGAPQQPGGTARGAPEEIDRQEGRRLLEALRRGEKPLQMQLFQLREYDDDSAREEEKDW